MCLSQIKYILIIYRPIRRHHETKNSRNNEKQCQSETPAVLGSHPKQVPLMIPKQIHFSE